MGLDSLEILFFKATSTATFSSKASSVASDLVNRAVEEVVFLLVSSALLEEAVTVCLSLAVVTPVC